MLGMGFARVSRPVGEKPEIAPAPTKCWRKNRGARKSKLGLWRKPYYAIRGAESVAELSAERGHFTVVEGKVQSVRESGGTIY